VHTKTTCFAAGLLLCGALTADAQQVPAAGRTPGTVAASPPLTFQAAFDMASARNLGLEAARRQRAIREAQVRIARQLQNPDVALEVSRDVPHEVLTLNVPIEIGGKRARRIDLARAEAAQADIDVRVELRTLRRNLRQAFYGLLAADERVRLSEEILALAERVRQVAQVRFEEGATPRLDVLEADLGLARARADLDLARSTRASAQADLNAVLDQPAGQAVAVTGDLAATGAVPDLARATEQAAGSNTDLLAAEQEAAVEERRVSLLKAERIPTPTFSIGGVFDAPGEFQAGWAGGVSFGLPLFNRNQGEIAAARATIFQLHARRDAVRRIVENAVFGAVARIDAQRRQVEIYRVTIIPAATELAALAEESYKMGRNPVLALLDAQRSLRDVRREYLQALVEFQSAIADLEEVVGAAIQ
jgi:cobalt-zinc-cadmium efflux system outer membrane protein